MWPLKKTRNLAGPEELPAAIDALAEKLRAAGFVVEAEQFHHLVHEFVATRSNEMYADLHLALKRMDHERRALPREVAAEVRHLIKSVDYILR
jgi:uncharacterized protein with von Willebrand factor type A (vWA) domain